MIITFSISGTVEQFLKEQAREGESLNLCAKRLLIASLYDEEHPLDDPSNELSKDSSYLSMMGEVVREQLPHLEKRLKEVEGTEQLSNNAWELAKKVSWELTELRDRIAELSTLKDSFSHIERTAKAAMQLAEAATEQAMGVNSEMQELKEMQKIEPSNELSKGLTNSQLVKILKPKTKQKLTVSTLRAYWVMGSSGFTELDELLKNYKWDGKRWHEIDPE